MVPQKAAGYLRKLQSHLSGWKKSRKRHRFAAKQVLATWLSAGVQSAIVFGFVANWPPYDKTDLSRQQPCSILQLGAGKSGFKH